MPSPRRSGFAQASSSRTIEGGPQRGRWPRWLAPRATENCCRPIRRGSWSRRLLQVGEADWMTAERSPRLVPTGDIRPIIELGIQLQTEASGHHIHNVFDDGGYKELILLRLFNLRKLAREGHDAVDANGQYYEIKTAARVSSSGKRKTSLGVTTEHTLTKANIERYRRAFLWIVAVFDQSHPET